MEEAEITDSVTSFVICSVTSTIKFKILHEKQ